VIPTTKYTRTKRTTDHAPHVGEVRWTIGRSGHTGCPESRRESNQPHAAIIPAKIAKSSIDSMAVIISADSVLTITGDHPHGIRAGLGSLNRS
jgi:hypothetical protein